MVPTFASTASARRAETAERGISDGIDVVNAGRRHTSCQITAADRSALLLSAMATSAGREIPSRSTTCKVAASASPASY